MKLAIEIDEEVYKEITSHTDKRYSFVYLGLDQLKGLDNAIRNGRLLPEPTCIDCALCRTNLCHKGKDGMGNEKICKDFLQGV